MIGRRHGALFCVCAQWTFRCYLLDRWFGKCIQGMHILLVTWLEDQEVWKECLKTECRRCFLDISQRTEDRAMFREYIGTCACAWVFCVGCVLRPWWGGRGGRAPQRDAWTSRSRCKSLMARGARVPICGFYLMSLVDLVYCFVECVTVSWEGRFVRLWDHHADSFCVCFFSFYCLDQPTCSRNSI